MSLSQPTSSPGPPTSRLVAIWVPDWPVVALTLETRQQRRHPCTRRSDLHLPDPATAPVAVVGARGVLAASAPARSAGITTGMRLRAARSICPGLTALPPQEDPPGGPVEKSPSPQPSSRLSPRRPTSSARSASPTPCPEPSWPPVRESSSNQGGPPTSSPPGP